MAFFLRIALISLAVALASAMSTCVEQGDWKACDADDQCTWCLGGSVGTGCYPLSAAKVLPKSFFTCDNEGYGATRNDDTCDNKTEDECISPECVWCTSAAVGGGCYTPTQAKLLPAAIFKCKTAPQAAAA